MAVIRDAKREWSNQITIDNDEIWQARAGRVYLTTTDDPESDAGLLLKPGASLNFAAGVKVRYWTDSKKPTLIAREAVFFP